MSDELDLYTVVSEGFDTRLRNVKDDQWGAQTPCEDWDVTALVKHLIGTHHFMLSFLGQTYEGPDDQADLLRFWTEARAAVTAALADPEIADKVVQAPFGAMPFRNVGGGLLLGDTLFHTWDLARATGQDETLDPAACERVLSNMMPMDDLIRGPGRFDPKIESPSDADVQTRLLHFGGRQP